MLEKGRRLNIKVGRKEKRKEGKDGLCCPLSICIVKLQ